MKSKVTYSLQDLKNDLNLFWSFLKNNKLTIILTWFFILMAYGIKLFFYSISIDTEAIINDYNGQLNAWLTIGRFGLIFTKKLLRLCPFNPYVACFLMICTIFLFSIFISFLFNYLTFEKNTNNKLNLIIPSLFISTPLFAEQFNFILQGFEVALAILLTSISAFLITKWVIDNKNIVHLILGTICMVWAFASYQAVVFLYISLVLACYYFIYINNTKSKINLESNFFKKAPLKYIIIFCLGYLLYILINKLILIKIGATPYLDNMISWGSCDVIICIRKILDYILQFKTYVFLSTIILFFGFSNLFTKNKNKILFLLSSIALVLSPFFLAFYLGHDLPQRSQFSLQFVYAFAIYLLAYQLKNKKIFVSIIIILSIALSFNHAYRVSNLLYTDYMKYQSEVSLANKITDRIDNLNLDDNFKYPVAFVGSIHPLSTPNELRGDIIGASFFEWDSTAPYGSNYRILGFMRTIGYPYKWPNMEEIERSKKIATEMKCWPNTESVKFKDGIIVVKLS